ncbi:hypothetical protein H7J07_00060 [Mycobacterium koreense]|uniref:Uncharacterized protein n=1 Tax=Mycolicibacillus koreensis TaxID=1069220 RepID=A0A7I7SIL1_9MYCO|nr:hypothetical protein [Mycolicibacillus koreensis]MCV7246658.1 hypothetical protein [Mycolicibacillus koreensis]OSC25225.1 hypothetical protein B8W67_19145 [Mycolicibacillus koreensis]BBY56089.1 hypothetical protein MKOR_33400 [Mycolicibacillus koreensis]
MRLTDLRQLLRNAQQSNRSNIFRCDTVVTGTWEARAWFRDTDGITRQPSARGVTEAKAKVKVKAKLRAKMRDRKHAPARRS